MTLAAEIGGGTNRANKSTGPRTEAGKARSRMNAVKHGMTARVVLLPDEKPAEFRGWMTGYFDSLKPRNQLEIGQVERIAYLKWQLDRAIRAQSARLCEQAHSGAEEKRNRVEQEVGELTRKLMRAPYGRPAAVPFGERPDDESTVTFVGSFEDSDHPAELTRRLQESGPGCQWLLARWSDLESRLNGKEMCWRAPERFLSFRMLGIHAVDARFTSELTMLLLACRTLDPGAGSLIGEIWNECVPLEALPVLEGMYEQAIGYEAAMDRDAARAHLLKIVAREKARLEKKAAGHAERAERDALLAQHRAAFDDTREGELMRRYEASCEKLFLRHLDELHKGRAEQRKSGEPPYRGGYYRPSPDWFRAPGEETDGEGGEKPEARGDEAPEARGDDREEAGGVTETSREELDGNSPWDFDCEDEEPAGIEGKEEEAERVVESPPVQVVQERPRLEPGYTNKVMTGSKRERRRLRKLEREHAAKARRRGAAKAAS